MNRVSWSLRLIAGLLVLLTMGLGSPMLGQSAPGSWASPNSGPDTRAASNANLAVGANSLPRSANMDGEPPVNCSDIKRYNIDRQTNMRAAQILIACGYASGGTTPAGPPPPVKSARSGGRSPNAIGGLDVNTIAGGLLDTYPHVTQAESFVWANAAAGT